MAIHRIQQGKLDRLMRTKGKHPDGGGLYLQVASAGQASWVWRHKERWASIGPARLYSITEARNKAHGASRAAHEGKDPFEVLSGGRAQPAGKLFGEAMEEYLAAKSPTWADSNRDRGLQRYWFLFGKIPDFVALPISSIDQDAKNKALAVWPADTKRRRDVGFYIEAIIRYAETGKLRLHKRGDDDAEHHEAMPWANVPDFYKRLADVGTVDARALQWTILTGARTDEVIGAKRKGAWTKHPATWAEIEEVDGKPVWVIPRERMKARKPHRVPLTAEALALLGKRRADNTPLFKASSANAMLNTLKALDDGNGYTVHGFRSSFEDWGAEATSFPRDLVKLCIAHDKRTKTDRAYQRSDLLEKRREIMERWLDFVTRARS
jgi:integrase